MKYVSIEELGNLAKQLRLDSDLSQTQVAEMIGTTQSNISAAESGKSKRYVNVAICIIEKLSNAAIKGPFFGIEIEEL